ELRDYKFHCLNGEPRMLVIMSNRYSKDGKHNFNAFDMDFKPLKTHFGGNGYSPSDEDFKRPVCFEEMKVLARKLSSGIPFVRVDFYCIRGKIYFGELTFYPTSGLDNQSSDEWDLEFGSRLDLKLA
ncbi:MAG: ATP-grasp fold amidoligase family protein, partial [Prevotellaceae bacterium]|nr:ATP-grasp fold amidoligase family protein [Prevotellaceae bacterium]